MKKKMSIVIPLLILGVVFVYFNSEFFFSQVPMRKDLPASLNIIAGFRGDQPPLLEVRLEKTEDIEAIRHIIRGGVEILGHEHPAFAVLDFQYADGGHEKVAILFVRHGEQLEFKLGKKMYILNRIVLFDTLKKYGVDLYSLTEKMNNIPKPHYNE